MLALRRERGQIGERGADIAQRALAGLEREVGLGGKRFHARGKLRQLGERLLPHARLARLRLGPLGLLRRACSRPFLPTTSFLFGLFFELPAGLSPGVVLGPLRASPFLSRRAFASTGLRGRRRSLFDVRACLRARSTSSHRALRRGACRPALRAGSSAALRAGVEAARHSPREGAAAVVARRFADIGYDRLRRGALVHLAENGRARA